MTAPRDLKPPTRKWFDHVTTAYVLEEHHVKMLHLACQAWDRCQQAREQLAAEGVTFTDRFGQPHAHPAVAIERDARIAFARLLRELDLDGEPAPDPRPPRRGGR